jgi:hypothetical protein
MVLIRQVDEILVDGIISLRIQSVLCAGNDRDLVFKHLLPGQQTIRLATIAREFENERIQIDSTQTAS